MKKTIIFVATALITMTTFAQSKNFLDTPYLETSSQVDTLVTPDKIYLNIIIQEKDTKGRVSVEEQENQMAQRFKAMGIDLDKQLVIKDMGSNFKKYFLRFLKVNMSHWQNYNICSCFILFFCFFSKHYLIFVSEGCSSSF